jgi:hypothetical protein
MVQREKYNYLEGIRLDDSGHYVFDKQFDFDTDIIQLTTDTSGIKNIEGLTYYYGYEFNPKIKSKTDISKFRKALKHEFTNSDVFYSDEAEDFVIDGIYQMDKYKSLNDFGVVISTASYYGENTLTGLMCKYVWEESRNDAEVVDLQLIKELAKNVTFNEQKADKALANTIKYKNPIKRRRAIEDLKREFEKAKKSNAIFKMKKYLPSVARVGFTNFLKFANEEEEELYKTLDEGTEVLICEDFITSGSTVKEIIRFLNSVNPNNKISVYVLINQARNY